MGARSAQLAGKLYHARLDHHPAHPGPARPRDKTGRGTASAAEAAARRPALAARAAEASGRNAERTAQGGAADLAHEAMLSCTAADPPEMRLELELVIIAHGAVHAISPPKPHLAPKKLKPSKQITSILAPAPRQWRQPILCADKDLAAPLLRWAPALLSCRRRHWWFHSPVLPCSMMVIRSAPLHMRGTDSADRCGRQSIGAVSRMQELCSGSTVGVHAACSRSARSSWRPHAA